jgi:hypothetical protein
MMYIKVYRKHKPVNGSSTHFSGGKYPFLIYHHNAFPKCARLFFNKILTERLKLFIRKAAKRTLPEMVFLILKRK